MIVHDVFREKTYNCIFPSCIHHSITGFIDNTFIRLGETGTVFEMDQFIRFAYPAPVSGIAAEPDVLVFISAHSENIREFGIFKKSLSHFFRNRIHGKYPIVSADPDITLVILQHPEQGVAGRWFSREGDLLEAVGFFIILEHSEFGGRVNSVFPRTKQEIYISYKTIPGA